LTLRKEHAVKVFENRVLRKIFGLKRNEATGGWKKFHNKELYNLYSSPIIIKMTKSTRMRWTGHAARMDRRKMHAEYWWDSQKEGDDYKEVKKSKAIPVTGLGGLWGCEILRFSLCLDNQPYAPAALYSQETLLFLCFWFSFLLEAE
jgi:hypothetical protein